MRVMVIVKANKDSEAGVLPSREILSEMGKFNEELVKAGVMLAGEGLHSSAKGVRVKFGGGNCREALNFYAETLGGRIVFAMTYGEAPGSENAPAEVRRQIIHARVDFGGQYLLGCDAPADRYQAPQGFAVMAALEKPADAERIFKALAESGTISMPFQETFWAHGFGMCTDRFGTPWMVNCAKPPEAVEAVRGRSSASAGRA